MATVMRNAYSPQERVQFVSVRPSRTKQSFKDECDINILMKKYQNTGEIPANVRKFSGYGDVSKVGDLLSSYEKVAEARAEMARLPAKVRERFGQDVGALLRFVADRKNQAEAVELGLVEVPPPPPPPAPVPEVK